MSVILLYLRVVFFLSLNMKCFFDIYEVVLLCMKCFIWRFIKRQTQENEQFNYVALCNFNNLFSAILCNLITFEFHANRTEINDFLIKLH